MSDYERNKAFETLSSRGIAIEEILLSVHRDHKLSEEDADEVVDACYQILMAIEVIFPEFNVSHG